MPRDILRKQEEPNQSRFQFYEFQAKKCYKIYRDYYETEMNDAKC